jgi:signal transduction histidine kinase
LIPFFRESDALAVNSIFRKGLLLIAAPLVFQAIFFVVLLRNERENAGAERWALHTRLVISQAETSMRLLVQESSRVRGLIITGNPLFTQSSFDRVRAARKELLRLVADNPAQQRRVEAFLRTSEDLETWIADLEALVQEGRTTEAAARIKGLRGERLLRNAGEQIDAILTAEQQLDRERLDDLEAIRSRQRWLLLGSAITAAAIAVFLAWIFARGISLRLEIERRLKSELERHAADLALVNEDLRFKTQEIETFVYSVSHDLRSPLVNLQGFSRELELSCKDLQQALGKAELAPELRRRLDAVDRDMLESVRYILTAVSRLGNIIDALLRLSRAGRVEYQWQRVDVDTVVRRVVDAMRGTIQAKGAQVTVGALPPAWGDPTAVEQIFGNLLGNALNYLDPGRPGRIEIGAENDSSPITYRVCDNGLGIPEKYQSKLFVAFQRLHGDIAPGEGIGLALVRRMVERHGGKIRVESREGSGTAFFLTLPPAEEDRMGDGVPPNGKTA